MLIVVGDDVYEPLNAVRHPRLYVRARRAADAATASSGGSDGLPPFLHDALSAEDAPTLPASARQKARRRRRRKPAQQQRGPAVARCPARLRVLELALAADNALCARFDNRVGRLETYLQATVQTVSAAYERAFCIRVVLIHLEAHCKNPGDPYKSLARLPKQTLLLYIDELWRSSARRVAVRADVAILLSGVSGGRLAGTAWVGSMCKGSYGAHGFTRGPVDPTVIGHELAHTLGATHVRDGAMRRALPPGAQLWFSTDTRRQVRVFLGDTARSECLVASPLPRRCPRTKCRRGVCRRGVCVRRWREDDDVPAPDAPRCRYRGFDSKRLPACARERREKALPLAATGASVRVSLRVAFSMVQVRVTVTGGAAAVLAGAAVGEPPEELSTPTWFSGAARPRFDWLVGRLRRASGLRSCCGHPVLVVVRAVACSATRCSVKVRTYSVRLPCVDVCGRRGGVPLGMSKQRRCPVCQRKRRRRT